MAVIVRPRQPGWQDYLMQAVSQLGGGLINQMFERDSMAKQQKYQQQAMLEKNQMERANMTANIGMLKEQGVPDQMIGAAMVKLMGGPDTTEMYQHFNPHQTAGSFDTGGAISPYSFNPMNGQYAMQEAIQKTVDPAVSAEIAGRANVANINKSAALGSAGISAGASRYATDQRREAAQQQNQNYNKPSFGQPQIDANGNFVQFDQSGNVKQHNIGSQPRSGNYIKDANDAIGAMAPMGVEPDTDPRVRQLQDEVFKRLGIGGETVQPDFVPQPEQPQAGPVRGDPAPIAGRDATGTPVKQNMIDFEGIQIPDANADVSGMTMTPQQAQAYLRAHGLPEAALQGLGIKVQGF